MLLDDEEIHAEYEIIRMIDRGGGSQGTIYLAREKDISQMLVVLKVT